MNLAERLILARERMSLTQEELAQRVGISQVAINKLEKGKARQTRYLIQIAQALKTTPEWLLFGNGEDELQFHPINETINIPLLEWVILIKYGKDFCKFVNENKEVKMVSAPKSVGANAFAVLVESDSMVSPHAGTLSFFAGMKIFCNPTAKIESADFVIARHKIEERCLFRQYILEGGQAFLKPLNHQYKMENAEEYEILGVVVGYQGTLKDI